LIDTPATFDAGAAAASIVAAAVGPPLTTY